MGVGIMFEVTTHSIGMLKPKDKLTLEFPYRDIKVIEWTASCGCYSVKDTGEKIVIKYTAPEIPEHVLLEGRDTIKINQQVVVKYISSREEEVKIALLDFHGKVKGKLKF
jgi:hypothetical protein